jgi:hypothetical protein
LFWKAARIGEWRDREGSERGSYSSLCRIRSTFFINLPRSIFPGERLSPWVALSCFAMAGKILFG